jgi:hypothetical protein
LDHSYQPTPILMQTEYLVRLHIHLLWGQHPGHLEGALNIPNPLFIGHHIYGGGIYVL